jgi:hypothetical protein
MTIRTGYANHVEMVHRPGEGDLARKLFALLGCPPVDLATPFVGTRFQSSADETLWLSEVTPEQWAFELWLQEQLAAPQDERRATYAKAIGAYPQKFPHFGIGTATLRDWEALVETLQDAAQNDPDFKGRISLPHIKRPQDPGSLAALTGGAQGRTFYQAFLRTDIVSAGLLTLGQNIDIQHYRENDPAFREAARADV